MYIGSVPYLCPIVAEPLYPLVRDHGGLREHVGDQVGDLHAEGIVGIFGGVLDG